MADARRLPEPAAVAARTAELGFGLDAVQASRLADYLGLLVDWNRRMNLVGPYPWPDILARLVMDSLHLGRLLAELREGGLLADQPRSLDLGSGAGLPGIPLRVVWPAGEYAMVEAREKRATFLKIALARLGLERTRAVHGRVENLPRLLPAFLPADLVLARAFVPWPELLALVRPLLVPDGLVVVFANEAPPDRARAQPGFLLAMARSYAVAGGERFLWVFRAASGAAQISSPRT